MGLFSVFVLSRLADIGSTILNVYRFGYDPSIEISPVNRAFLEAGIFPFVNYQLLLIVLAYGIYLNFRIGKYFILIMTVFSLIVSIVNIATLIATYFV